MHKPQFSFSKKVILFTFLVSLLSISLISIAMIGYEWNRISQEFAQDIAQQAQLVSQYSVQAVKDQDKVSLEKIVAPLLEKKEIKSIGVYLKDAQAFYASALHTDRAVNFKALAQPTQRIDSLQQGFMIYQPIHQGEQYWGTLVVSTDLAPTYKFSYHLLLIIGTGGVCLLITMLWAWRWQSRLSQEFNSMFEKNDKTHYALKLNEERLNLALIASNEVLIDWDIEQDTFYFGDNFEEIVGYPFAERPTCILACLNLIYPDDVLAFQDNLSAHLKGETQFFESVQRLRHKQGHYLWSCIRGKIVTYDALGKPIRMTGTFGDITQKKEAEEKFRIYQKIFSSTNEGIMVTDKNLKILKVNTAFEKITGFTEQQVKCKPIAIFHSDKHSSSFYSHIHQTLAQDGSWQGEIWEKRQCGDIYPQWLSISSIYDEKNTLLYYVGIFRDLTKNRQIEEQLEYLSNYDLVTELPNRNWYLLKLQRAIHFAQQCQEPLAVVMLGIDKFKTIDDTLGYETGDQLLKKITQRLKKIVPNVDNISTLSRDEFAFFLDGQVTHSSITKIVKKLIAKLNHYFYINSQELLVNIYVGISLYPKDAQDAKSILANANTAMCEIKKNERNAFLFFEPYMNTQRLERVRMESLLRNALVNNELMLYYQPKIDTLSGKISGCEALLRWDNPELGLVSPEKFIPLAEEIGLIVPIGNWVIQQACEQAAQWVQLGFHELRVSVNVSGHQFFKSGLDQWVAQILAQTQLAPHNLELEITEGVVLDNIERCVLILRALKAMGLYIAIDDFGTGYSSLSYLSKLPVDIIKIDRSFVNNITTSKEDSNIIQAIIAMAHGLELKTIAEGVEEAAQLTLLQAMNCYEIQGYYFSRPLSAAQFSDYLRNFNFNFATSRAN